MRTKKILLLSCLYPLILFLIIGYTFSYSSKKASTEVSQQQVTLLDYSFTSPIPTTLVFPTTALTPEEASHAANAEVESKDMQAAEPTLKQSKDSDMSSRSAEIGPVQISSKPEAVLTSISPTAVPSSTPSPAVFTEEAVSAKSAKIINSASSMIIPASSSVIIESGDVITP